MFTDPAARHVFGQTWAEEARRMVSLFRAGHDLWPGDMAFAALVDGVRASCLEFKRDLIPPPFLSPTFFI
jgi:hypothetical protein